MTLGTKLKKFNKFLAAGGLKATRQRDLIVRAFFEAGRHTSAEELYRHVHARDPRIGLVTVYRTLKLLRDAGLAEELRFADNFARYDPNLADGQHDHLVCSRCGKILEFDGSPIAGLQRAVGKQFEFTVHGHRLQIYGLCCDCTAAGPRRAAAGVT